MAPALQAYNDKKVCIITTDGRCLVGTLVASDISTNLVLSNAVLRDIRAPEDGEPSTETELGVQVIRGEMVCVVGLVDEALDASINWAQVKGEAIGTTKH